MSFTDVTETRTAESKDHPEPKNNSETNLGAGITPTGSFPELAVGYEDARKALWCFQKHTIRPNFTASLLRDLLAVLEFQRQSFAPSDPLEDWGFRYWVFGSATPGIYNLGGDLTKFAQYLRSGRRAEMFEYAKACIDACFTNYVNNHLPIISIALVQGDALGGGFEAALSCDVVVAERGSKLGFPEILFGLFPGMGAYSFVSRKIGAKAAETLILEGRIFDADELKEIGLVDIVAPPGGGRDAVRKFIDDNDKNFRALRAIYDIRRMTDEITYEEMIKIGEKWVDAAMRLRNADLKKMERLARAQGLRFKREMKSRAP